jgi:hypothetical protein
VWVSPSHSSCCVENRWQDTGDGGSGENRWEAEGVEDQTRRGWWGHEDVT